MSCDTCALRAAVADDGPRQRQRELVFDFVESKAPGEADRELSTYDRQHPEAVRRKLYKSFGLGSEGGIRAA